MYRYPYRLHSDRGRVSEVTMGKIRQKQTNKTKHDIEWRFHLLYNPQGAGLAKKKDKWNVLTSKTTLASYTEVLSQTLLHLNDPSAGFLVPYARLGTPTETPNIAKAMEVARNKHCPDSHYGSTTCYAVESSKCHYTWKINYLLEFAVGHPTGMGEFLCSPRWGGTAQSPLGASCLATSSTCWCTISGMEHAPLKEGRRWEFWSGRSLPAVHLLMPENAASPSQYMWCVQWGRVPKTVSLHLLKARWAHSVSHWFNHLAAIFIPSKLRIC